MRLRAWLYVVGLLATIGSGQGVRAQTARTDSLLLHQHLQAARQAANVGNWQQCRGQSTAALPLARRWGWMHAKGDAALLRAEAAAQLGHWRDALYHLLLANYTFRSLADSLGMVRTQIALAQYYGQRNMPNKSLEYINLLNKWRSQGLHKSRYTPYWEQLQSTETQARGLLIQKAAGTGNYNAAEELEANELEKELHSQVVESEVQGQVAALRLRDSVLRLREAQLLLQSQRVDSALRANRALHLDRLPQLLRTSRAEQGALEATRAAERLRARFETQWQEQALAEQKRQRELETLRTAKEMQELRLQKELQKAFYGYLALLLVASFLGFAMVALRISRKQKQKLQVQNSVIKAKNSKIETQANNLSQAHSELLYRSSELESYQEEIMMQRDNLAAQYTLLERQNFKIAQSIQSALLIQSAIIFGQSSLPRLFAKHMVYFRPRDVVSGDFYWCEQLGEATYLAVVDCTGHGVPGALMSLVANNYLNKVLRDEAVHEPGAALNRLHESIYRELQQATNNNADGMDVALVRIEAPREAEQAELYHIAFAGAKRPLYYLPADGQEMLAIPGDRLSIGGHEAGEQGYRTQHLQLPAGSCLYLASDGYADQNDAMRKRLGSQQFMQVLQQCACLPAAQQHELLDKVLSKRLEGTEQRDDILIVGLTLE